MSGQLWAVNTLGGYLHADNLSQELRVAVQPMQKFRQFCDVKDAAFPGKKKGDTFHWDVCLDVATQGATLTETNTMPQTNFTIAQGTATINERGNSVPYSGKLEALSDFNVKGMVMKALKNDASKAFDIAAHAEFNSARLVVCGTATDGISLTTTGTANGTNSVGMLRKHVQLISDTMKERNIPYYSDDAYMAIAHPSTLRKLKQDLESVNQYVTEGYQKLYNGEIGKYENVRFVEQTNIAKEGHTYTDWCFFFGADTVAEAIAIPEEVRAKISTDYGRDQGIAWYYLGGFALVHEWASLFTQDRVVKWDSQA